MFITTNIYLSRMAAQSPKSVGSEGERAGGAAAAAPRKPRPRPRGTTTPDRGASLCTSTCGVSVRVSTAGFCVAAALAAGGADCCCCCCCAVGGGGNLRLERVPGEAAAVARARGLPRVGEDMLGTCPLAVAGGATRRVDGNDSGANAGNDSARLGGESDIWRVNGTADGGDCESSLAAAGGDDGEGEVDAGGERDRSLAGAETASGDVREGVSPAVLGGDDSCCTGAVAEALAIPEPTTAGDACLLD